jgi:hypothetical protein
LYVATITPGFDQQPDYSSITNPTEAGIRYGATGIEDEPTLTPWAGSA